MSQKPKALLFGASIAGQRVLRQIERQAEIIGFVDNDPRKHGRRLGPHRIHAPESIHSQTYDYIVISSMYVAEIHAQLLKMGIPPQKITSVFQDSQAEPVFPWDAVLFLGFGVVVLTAGVLAWLL